MSDWRDITGRTAYKWAESFYDGPLKDGVLPGIKKGLPARREEAIYQLATQFVGPIREFYKEENWNDAEKAELTKFPAKKGYEWTMGLGKALDPKTVVGQEKFEKFNDLVKHKDLEDLPKWQGMSNDQLDYKMKEMGYNPGDPESKQKFWKDLRGHQLNFDRMKAVESTGTGWLVANALLNPTAFDEAMKQSLTDAPADPGKVYDKFIIDQTANAVIGANTRSALPALLLGTAGGEFARQALNKYVDPEDEFKVGPIVAAPLAAGITSGGVRGVGRLMGRVKFPGFQGFGRGMMKGARGVNDVEAQKDALKNMLLGVRKGANETASTAAQQAERDADREIAHNTLKLLGFNEMPMGEAAMNQADLDDMAARVMMNDPEGRTYSIAQMLGNRADNVTPVTDKQASAEIDRAFEKPFNLYKSEDPMKFKLVTEPLSEIPQVPSKEVWNRMSAAEQEESFTQLLKDMHDFARYHAGEATEADKAALARSQDQYVKNIAAIKSNPYLKAKWEREAEGDGAGSLVRRALIGDAAGNGPAYLTGDIVAGSLGAFEPMTRWSPWPVVQSLYGGNVEAAKKQVGAKKEEYKNASWYKKLKKANPQAAAAFDAAVKAKEDKE